MWFVHVIKAETDGMIDVLLKAIRVNNMKMQRKNEAFCNKCTIQLFFRLFQIFPVCKNHIMEWLHLRTWCSFCEHERLYPGKPTLLFFWVWDSSFLPLLHYESCCPTCTHFPCRPFSVCYYRCCHAGAHSCQINIAHWDVYQKALLNEKG